MILPWSMVSEEKTAEDWWEDFSLIKKYVQKKRCTGENGLYLLLDNAWLTCDVWNCNSHHDCMRAA